jgi:adenylosuccinate lyase
MKRLFWLGVGVAAGVALSRKAKNAARQASPAGIAANLGDAMRELATAVGSFGADIRAGMAEREEELSEMVEQRSGVSPMAHRALGAHRTDARARRANG